MSRPPLDALLAEGSLAGQAGDFDQAIACFRAALRQAPRHAGIMLFLSKAYGLSFHYPEAEHWLSAALRVAPSNQQVLHMAAQNCLEWDRPQGALPLLKQVAAVFDNSANWTQLGRALERANQLESATQALRRAEGLAPREPGVLQLRGRLAQRTGDFPEAERCFVQALAQKPSPEREAELWYSCATIFDAAGRFDEAWAAADRAKALQRPLAEALIEPADAWRREVDALQAGLSVFNLPAEDQGAVSQLVVLCGYPRSGTTLLGQVLAGHPHVTYADEVLALARTLRLGENLTEPPRPDWFLHAQPGQRRNLRREYRRCLEAHLGRRLDWSQPGIIDKNPAVTRCLPAMLSLFPKLKALFALRDPRDLAVSCYLRPFPVNPFTAHFNRLESLATHLRANYDVWKAICARLPLAHAELRYESLVASFTPTGRQACAFLGLDPGRLPADHRESAGRRFIHSPTYAEVLQPIHQRVVGRWRGYATQLGPQLQALNLLAREQGYD